jgi:hypothetical protein
MRLARLLGILALAPVVSLLISMVVRSLYRQRHARIEATART